MDGATNELLAAGYGRTAELKRLAEAAGERWAEDLAHTLWSERAWHTTGFLRGFNVDARGLPASAHDWPEWLWERFCCDSDSDGFDEDEVLAMRETFMRAAALQLENEGYCCR